MSSIPNPYVAGIPSAYPAFSPYAAASAQAFAGAALPVYTPSYAPTTSFPQYFPPTGGYTPSYVPSLPTSAYAGAQASAGSGFPGYLPAYTPSLPTSAYAGAQAYAGSGFPLSSYISPYATASAQATSAYAPTLPSYPAPAPYPTPAPPQQGSGSTDQLLMMLIMMLMNMNKQGGTQSAPSINNRNTVTNNNSPSTASNNGTPVADVLQKNPPTPQGKAGLVKKGAQWTQGADGNWHAPAAHKSGREAIMNPQGQIIQEARDPLTFDLGGDGIHTTNEKVNANIDGEQLTVNNIGSDDAVLTLNGQVVGEKADLSGLGITEKPKDAQDALRLIAEKAAKDGVISSATNLTDKDLETLHEKYGVSMRVGSLNAKDGSFADAGIHGVDLSTAASTAQNNFDGKGNTLTSNGTTFTRADGTKGNVGDIWYKK